MDVAFQKDASIVLYYIISFRNFLYEHLEFSKAGQNFTPESY